MVFFLKVLPYHGVRITILYHSFTEKHRTLIKTEKVFKRSLEVVTSIKTLDQPSDIGADAQSGSEARHEALPST